MAMVVLTGPLGLVGVVPMLLIFNQPFGFNAILGLIGLAGILMRNTLILTEQIKENRAAGLDDYHAVIEATVQRTRPVILTALAAVLAFIPLTHSVFWGSMAYTLIGGKAVGTVLILLFLPALHAAWFRIKPTADLQVNHSSPERPRQVRRSERRLRICLQVGRPPAAWSGYNFGDVRRGSTRWGSSSGDPLEDNNSTG